LDPISEYKASESIGHPNEARWLILANPKAGRGISSRNLADISAMFDADHISHEIILTESSDQLFKYASTAADREFEGVIACGGDGTVSSIAAGIVHSNSCIPISVLPAGSGNDWARNLGIKTFRDTLESIRANETCMMDAASCKIVDESGNLLHSGMFINSAGIGLDAHVLQKVMKLRERISLGRLGYISVLISTILKMPLWKGTMMIDEAEAYSGEYLSLTVGVCPYTGGGMMLSPTSCPFDDMLDTAVVKSMSRMGVIRSLPMIYKGTLLENPDVASWRGKELQFKAAGSVEIELDGEAVYHIPDNAAVIMKSIPSAICALYRTRDRT